MRTSRLPSYAPQALSRGDTKDAKGREGHEDEAAGAFVSLAIFVSFVSGLF